MTSVSLPAPLAPMDIQKVVNDYARQLSADDEAIGQQMQVELVRVVFEILINLSYVLFGLGLALGIKAGGLADLQRISQYISTPGNQAILCVVAFIALAIFSIAQVFSQSKALSTRAKRDLDLVVDLLRVVIYIFAAIFMGPFVYSEPQDMVLILSFWSLVLAATLFLIRKIMKWYVFLIKEPTNLKPWEDFVVTSPLQFAQFQQFLSQKVQEQHAAAAVAEAAKETSPIKTASQLPQKLTAFDLDDGLPQTRQGINPNEHELELPL